MAEAKAVNAKLKALTDEARAAERDFYGATWNPKPPHPRRPARG